MKLSSTLGRGMATEQAVRSELRMHGLMPYRHVPLQVEIDRADGALQACSTPLEQYKVLCRVYLLQLTAVSLLSTQGAALAFIIGCLAGLGCFA